MAGSLVHDAVAGSGVDTSLVESCEDAPTGLMLRDSPERGQRVEYYRRGSAASLMSPEVISVETCLDSRAAHITGITPALSDGFRRLVETLLSEPSDALRSFDLNWRPALWPDGPPRQLFRDLANLADIVFVGLDEASAVWGLSDPAEVRAALPAPRIVVVKDGGTGVHTFTEDAALFEPALRGPIVGPRGAGRRLRGRIPVRRADPSLRYAPVPAGWPRGGHERDDFRARCGPPARHVGHRGDARGRRCPVERAGLSQSAGPDPSMSESGRGQPREPAQR